jgi:TonB-dependent starch-binding outer membrane protein SusC
MWAVCALVLVSSSGCARRANSAPSRIEPTPQVSRVEELLIGKFAGVEVIQDNNGGYTVLIRGMGSAAPGGQPLWVIDGAAYEVHTSDALSWVNPNSVVKIEVLKNATDIALYGRRGSNGVIVVTTRRPGRQP